MSLNKTPEWILLEYSSEENLDSSIVSRDGRTIFYPMVGGFRQGLPVDIQITVENANVLFPMKAEVIEIRTKPQGPDQPMGTYLKVISEDKSRFDRMCAFADGMWKPSARRSSPRYQAEIRATYKFSKDFENGHTLDISTRGMYLRTDGPLPEPNSQVKVRLHKSRFRSAIEMDAVVRWVDEVQNRRGMGLECIGPNEALLALTSLVQKLVQESTPSD